MAGSATANAVLAETGAGATVNACRLVLVLAPYRTTGESSPCRVAAIRATADAIAAHNDDTNQANGDGDEEMKNAQEPEVAILEGSGGSGALSLPSPRLRPLIARLMRECVSSLLCGRALSSADEQAATGRLLTLCAQRLHDLEGKQNLVDTAASLSSSSSASSSGASTVDDASGNSTWLGTLDSLLDMILPHTSHPPLPTSEQPQADVHIVDLSTWTRTK